MRYTCPHCAATVEVAGVVPKFCPGCGGALADTVTQPATDPVGSDPFAPLFPTPAADPDTVGGYRIVKRLGVGGMGAVYEAEVPGTNRRVALKLIRYRGVSPDTLERFRQEGRLASQVVHPRCVFVLAADEDAGRPYIVMELMTGQTLHDVVAKHGPAPVEVAVDRILDVIDGLLAAHRLGVIHRDVKPSNCFLEAGGRVKVGDFGLAKSLIVPAHLTRTGAFLGTPLFASPEQVRGEKLDVRTDVYSTAATLYHSLTGRAPHQRATDAAAAIARIASDDAPPPSQFRPGLSPALERVVLRGLARDPAERWPDLEAFRAALRPFAPGQLGPATLGLRFGAYLIDYVLLLPIGLATYAAALWLDLSPGLRAALVFTAGLDQVAYFALTEGLGGAGVGKLALGLRVWRADDAVPPGLGRSLVRALVFYLLLMFVPAAIDAATMGDFLADDAIGDVLQAIALVPLGLGLLALLAPMRWRNGYRGTHEWLSGTRTVRLPEPDAVRPRPPLRGPLPPAEGTFGPYRATARLGDGLVLGDDPSLGRPVLVWVRPATAPPLPPQRTTCGRLARLRWLASGETGDRRWDAFVAPTGASLEETVEATGRWGWSATRPLLEELAEELDLAAADGTRPQTPTRDHLWVQSDGRVLLLDWPLALSPSPPALRGRGDGVEPGAQATGPHIRSLALPAPPPRPRSGAEGDLVRDAAFLTLVGDARTPDGPPRVPLPLHARELLATSRSVAEYRAVLADTRHQPATATRARRAAQLTLLALLLLPGLCFMFVYVGIGVSGAMVAFNARDEADRRAFVRERLDAVAAAEFAAAQLATHPIDRLPGAVKWQADRDRSADLDRDRDRHVAVRQVSFEEIGHLGRTLYGLSESLPPADRPEWWLPQSKERSVGEGSRVAFLYRGPALRDEATNLIDADQSDEVFFLISVVTGTIFVAFWPPLWVLWSFATRGGFSLRWSGLALVDRRGRPAARWRCAGRTLLVWLPVLTLLLAVVALENAFWRGWEPGGPRTLLRLSRVVWWTALGVLVGYVLLVLRRPTRSLLDRLAGTWVVPR